MVILTWLERWSLTGLEPFFFWKMERTENAEGDDAADGRLAGHLALVATGVGDADAVDDQRPRVRGVDVLRRKATVADEGVAADGQQVAVVLAHPRHLRRENDFFFKNTFLVRRRCRGRFCQRGRAENPFPS